ncbi:hypothetical protein SCORR_v1c07370 [Spiroplasma corruscae]|uniref:Uncharacterized protein n=1 Tax=Spiroplasma corruscae TaxID=216934 RepID=A0A222EPP6_9MOLU|nr:hypothetical protein [Spiroplasma corruscae]ASP28509.1 hypothetical protein SCORR_v1c07370 [Spiroplasma corruscae]
MKNNYKPITKDYNSLESVINPKISIEVLSLLFDTSISKIEYNFHNCLNLSLARFSTKYLVSFIRKYNITDRYFISTCNDFKNLIKINKYRRLKAIEFKLQIIKCLLLTQLRYNPNVWLKLNKKEKVKYYSYDNSKYNYKLFILLMSYDTLQYNSININKNQKKILEEIKILIFNKNQVHKIDFDKLRSFDYLPIKYFVIQSELLINYCGYEKAFIKLCINIYFQMFILFINENNTKLVLN